MLRKIVEELSEVGERLGGKHLCPLAPVYLFAAGERDGDFDLTVSLEQLLEELEDQQLFSEQSDGCITLSLEYGSKEWDSMGKLGLVNEAGQFKSTLSQWMDYIMVRYQISQGIVLIRLDCSKEQRAETIWWRRFFRQLNRYRSGFLFLFQTEQSDMDSVEEWLSKECFCKKIELAQPDVEDYIRYFEEGLDRSHLKLSSQAGKSLRVILKKYKDEITCHTLEKWQQELVWEYFLKEPTGDGENTLPAACLDEERLQKYIFPDKGNKTIGFEVTKDASEK